MKTRVSGKTFDKKRLSTKDLLSLKGKKYERVRVRAQGLETSPPTAQVQEDVPQEVHFQGVPFMTKPTPGVSKSWDLVPKDDTGVPMGTLYMDDVGRVYDVDAQIGEIDEKKGASKKTAAEFKELFSSKYANWIKMQARLLAANNYGKWTSVEEASQHVDKATKEVAETLKKAVEGEVKRLVDEEREDILQDMTENMEFGPNLPQMGPDQTQMQQQPGPQAPMPPHPPQQEPVPQKIAPPASKISRKAKMTKSLRAAFDKAEEEEDCDCPVKEERDSIKNRREVYEKSADLDDLEVDPFEGMSQEEIFKMFDDNLRRNREALIQEIRLREEELNMPPTLQEFLDEMDTGELKDYAYSLRPSGGGPSTYGPLTGDKNSYSKEHQKKMDEKRKERREKRDKEREKNKDSCPFADK